MNTTMTNCVICQSVAQGDVCEACTYAYRWPINGGKVRSCEGCKALYFDTGKSEHEFYGPIRLSGATERGPNICDLCEEMAEGTLWICRRP